MRMTKLTNRLLAALLAWLGFDSAMDNHGKALAVVDMRTGDTTIIHHRAVVVKSWYRLRSKVPFIKTKDDKEGADTPEVVGQHEDTCPVHGDPMKAIAAMGVADEDDLEQFERYIQFINEHAEQTDAPQAVVDHATAANRTLLDVMSVAVTDPEQMRALMFACFSVSMESHKAQQAGFMPPPYVISDGLAMSFVQTLRSIEQGALPDDLDDPWASEEGGPG